MKHKKVNLEVKTSPDYVKKENEKEEKSIENTQDSEDIHIDLEMTDRCDIHRTNENNTPYPYSNSHINSNPMQNEVLGRHVYNSSPAILDSKRIIREDVGGGALNRFNLRSVATAIRMITPDQRERGWNEENIQNLGELYREATKFEKAHKKCREKNLRYHNIINIPMITLSSFLTLFIAIAGGGKVSGLDGNSYYYSEFAIGVFITILSALDKYFHNDVNGEKHHGISRQYYTVAQKIKKNIDTRPDDKTYISVYNKYKDRLISIRTSPGTLSIFPRVRKKYGIDDLD